MRTKPLALGLCNLMMLAIWDSTKADPLNRCPKRFELPPAVYQDFILQLNTVHLNPADIGRPDGVFLWCGVEVHPAAMGARPKLINASNVIEYL